MRRYLNGTLMASGCLLTLAAVIILSATRKLLSDPAEADEFPGVFAITRPATGTLCVAIFDIDGGREDAMDLHGIGQCMRGFDLIGLEEVHGDGGRAATDRGLIEPADQ